MKQIVIPTGKQLVMPTAKQVGQRLWTPADITTVGWWDLSDEDTITESAGSVSQWDDKSGNGNNATQGSGSNQPTTGGTIGTRNAITFDGVDDFFSVTNSPLATQDFSIFVVFTSVNTQADARWFRGAPVFMGDHGGTVNDAGIVVLSGTVAVGIRDATAYKASTTINDGNPFQFGFIRDQDATSYGYVNGTQEISQALNTCTLDKSWRIGANNDGTQPLDGTVGEIIALDSLASDETRQKVEGYLAWKWGIEASLPVAHPYKSEAPLA